VYGVITGESIGRLFIAGIIPGAVLMSCYALYIQIMKWINRRSLFEKGEIPEMSFSLKVGRKEKFFALKDASWGLFIPFLVIGGIYLGIFTPTEAGAVLVIYTIIVTMAILRTVSWRDLVDVSLTSVKVSSMILMIMVCARVFGSVIAQVKVADMFVEYAYNAALSVFIVIIIVTVLLLVLGLFLDSASILIIFVPVLYPLAKGIGIDPIWFGVYFIIMTEIGLLTPPVGLNLFVIRGISGLPMQTIATGSLPFVMVMLFVVFLLYLFPSLVTWLPSSMMG
jgi:C4-dicarboxylate transporter DctM subunit